MKKLWWLILLLVLVGGGFFVFETFFEKDNKTINLNEENIENKNVRSETVASSCLFFEEKYCKNGKLVYDENGKVESVEYSFDGAVKLFSPIDSDYSAFDFKSETISRPNTMIIGSKKPAPVGGKNIWYLIVFDGNFESNIKIDEEERISKGELFGTTFNKKNKLNISIIDVFTTKEDVVQEINVEETSKLIQ